MTTRAQKAPRGSRNRVFTASVTYEFPQAAPDTLRTAVAAGTPGTAARRALDEARRAFSGRRPSSIVILLELPDSRQEAP